MKFITSAFFCLAFLFFCLPSSVFAQVDGADGTNAEPGTILAEINLSNAELVTENGLNKVYFTVDNLGTKPESDVHYGLEIIKVGKDGSQELVDTYVSNIGKTVMPGASVPEELVYDSNFLPAGEYEVWVLAQTPGGLIVGIAMAGKVTSTESGGLAIDSLSCRLSISNVDEEYMINQGVDVATEEDLILKCPVTNFGTVARTITPTFVTHERSVFGDVVDMNYPVMTGVELLPGEEKVLELTLPKATRPQAYDLVVSYVSETDGVVSNKAVVHYVLQGESATVQSVKFSKETYSAGEEMELTILWSLSADNFPDSRSGGTVKSEEYYIDVVVTDKTGYVCGTANVMSGDDLATLKVPTAVACSDPTAVVSIKTASGQILDTESVTVVSPQIVEEESVLNTGPKRSSANSYMVIGLFALIGVVLLLWYARKNHNHISDTTKSLVFLLVFGAGLFVSVSPVEAVTWTHSAAYDDCSGSSGDGNLDCITRTVTLVTATVNADRTTYSPGQTIVLSGTVRNHACSNLYYGIGANLLGRQITFFEGRGSGQRNISGTFTAPTTPGNYTINLGICHTNASNCTSSRINFTVANPAVNGSCRSSHYQCSAGNSANARETATGYTWSCNGISGGRNASCSETKVNGSCGATVNSCATGRAANGSQTATHYTWSCNSTNGGTNASCSLPIPPTVDLNAAPSQVDIGGASNLSWTVGRADSCVASGAWSGTKSVSGGTETVNPTVPSTYTLTCTGNGVTVSDTAQVIVPSGTLAITSPGGGCTVPLGGSSCSVNLNWSTAGLGGTPSVAQGGVQFSTAASGPATRTVTPSDRTFTLRDTGSSLNLTAVANVQCSTGAVMVNGSCRLLPVITVVSEPDIVRRGETAPVTITVTSAENLSCVVQGAINTTFSHTGGAGPNSRIFTSEPLTSARLVEVTCTHTTYPELTGSASARINVIPSIEEI